MPPTQTLPRRSTLEATRVTRRPEAKRDNLESVSRLALFCCGMSKRATELLGELTEEAAGQARPLAERLAALDSPTRQAQAALAFGVRADAAQRLRSLMAECRPALMEEIYRRLPAYHRTLFPELAQTPLRPEPAPPRALATLAERLVREACR